MNKINSLKLTHKPILKVKTQKINNWTEDNNPRKLFVACKIQHELWQSLKSFHIMSVEIKIVQKQKYITYCVQRRIIKKTVVILTSAWVVTHTQIIGTHILWSER